MGGRKKDPSAVAACIVTLVLILLCGGLSLLPGNADEPSELSHLKCVIDFKAHDDTTRGLLTGYTYHLLERYAADNDATIDITVARKEESFIDSLKAGRIDILAIPYAATLQNDSLLASIPVDSVGIWLVPQDGHGRLKVMNRWLETYRQSSAADSLREVFLHTYDPIRRAATGMKIHYAGPYDGIIRDFADSLGWDWRLLAALIFQESMFRIDVRSARGAEGLMQMMPHTAGRMEADDLVNPRKSLDAGTKYLKLLHRRYSNAANPAEQIKLTIAAYNAGEGRIRDLLNYAASKGIESGRWDDIITVIPEMNDSTLMNMTDTVRLGVFKGEETIHYVERVISLYDAYRKICPE